MLFATDLDITVRRIPDQLTDQPADETYFIVIDLDTTVSSVYGDTVTRTLLDIPYEATGQGDCIILKETRGIYEWGASGSAWSYLVEISSTFDEVAVGIAITKAFEKIAELIGSNTPARELDREQALHSAQFGVLRQNPNLDSGSLTLVSEEHDRENGRWTFAFRPGDGWEYLAEVAMLGALPGLTRVRRTRLPHES